MIVAGILLAAGQGRRFGGQKLLAPLRGRPLVTWATEAMAGITPKVAVVSDSRVAEVLPGWRCIMVPPGGQANSLRAGLAALPQWDRVVICLGDMPDVTAAHVARIIAATGDRPAASHDGRAAMPPACFPRSYAERLVELTGDRGAGSLIAKGAALIAAPSLLRDVDWPTDLQ